MRRKVEKKKEYQETFDLFVGFATFQLAMCF